MCPTSQVNSSHARADWPFREALNSIWILCWCLEYMLHTTIPYPYHIHQSPSKTCQSVAWRERKMFYCCLLSMLNNTGKQPFCWQEWLCMTICKHNLGGCFLQIWPLRVASFGHPSTSPYWFVHPASITRSEHWYQSDCRLQEPCKKHPSSVGLQREAKWLEATQAVSGRTQNWTQSSQAKTFTTVPPCLPCP